MHVNFLVLLVLIVSVGFSRALEISYFSVRSPGLGRVLLEKKDYPVLTDALKAEFRALMTYCERESANITNDDVSVNPTLFEYRIAISCEENGVKVGNFYVNMDERREIVRKGMYRNEFLYPMVGESEKLFKGLIWKLEEAKKLQSGKQ